MKIHMIMSSKLTIMNKNKILYSKDCADESFQLLNINDAPKFDVDDFGGAYECVMKTDWSSWHEIYFNCCECAIEYSGVIVGSGESYNAVILGCGGYDFVYTISGDYFDIHSHPITQNNGKLSVYNIPSMIDYRGCTNGKLSVLVTAFGVIIYGSTYLRKYGHDSDHSHVLNNDALICHFIPWSKLNISRSSHSSKWFTYDNNDIMIFDSTRNALNKITNIEEYTSHQREDTQNLHLYDKYGKLETIVTADDIKKIRSII